MDVTGVVGDEDGVAWSVCVRDIATSSVVGDHGADRVVRIASVGKVLLLVVIGAQAEAGTLDPGLRLRRTADDRVADSGLWQHLAVDELTVTDLALLVGAVSDNLATNVLLRHVGLEAVNDQAADLGLRHTRLHDRVRDVRRASDPPTMATGTAAELSALMASLARGEVVSEPVSRRVLGWLGAGVDLSMVGASFGLDPLAHTDRDRGITLRNKTGTDTGVRADAGVVTGPARSMAYAVVANFDEPRRDRVLTAMRATGATIRAEVRG